MTRNLRTEKFGKVERKTFSRTTEIQPIPDLIEIQKDSYEKFINEGIQEVFEDFSPITDFSDHFELYFLDHTLATEPKYSEKECRDRPRKTKPKRVQQSQVSSFDLMNKRNKN